MRWCLVVGLLVSGSGAAAPSTPVWVVLARRSGVPQPVAMEVVRRVAAALDATALPPDDASSCKGRKRCLVQSARKQGASVVVAVELGAVMDEGVLRVEALSVEGDGTSLGAVEAEGATSSLAERVAPRLQSQLRPALAAVLAPTIPDAGTSESFGSIETGGRDAGGLAAPTGPAPVIASPPAPKRHAGRVVGISVAIAGALLGGASAVAWRQASVESRASLAACPDGRPCSSPLAFEQYHRAVGAQDVGLGLALAGGLAVLVGLAIAWLDP